MTNNHLLRQRRFHFAGSEEQYIRHLEDTVTKYMEYVEALGTQGDVQDRGRVPDFHLSLKSNGNTKQSSTQNLCDQEQPPSLSQSDLSGRVMVQAGPRNVSSQRTQATSRPGRKRIFQIDERGASSTARTSAGFHTQSSSAVQEIIMVQPSTKLKWQSSRPKVNEKASEFLKSIPTNPLQWTAMVNTMHLSTPQAILNIFQLLTLQTPLITTTAPPCDNGSQTSLLLERYSKLCDRLAKDASRAAALHYFSQLILYCIACVLLKTKGTSFVRAMVLPDLSEGYMTRMKNVAINMAILIERLEAELGCKASQLFLMHCLSMKTYRDWSPDTREHVFATVCAKFKSFTLNDSAPELRFSFSPVFLLTFMGVASLETVNDALGTSLTKVQYKIRADPYVELRERSDNTVSPMSLIINKIDKSTAFAPNGDQNIMLEDMDWLDQNSETL